MISIGIHIVWIPITTSKFLIVTKLASSFGGGAGVKIILINLYIHKYVGSALFINRHKLYIEG